MKVRELGLTCLALFLLVSAAVDAQSYGARLGVQRGGSVSFEPTGSGVMFGALDPTVRRWYVPQELVAEYQWRQWEYSNYARQPYQRYVNTNREGDYFYDFFGDYVSRGWLIYDWRHDQPQQGGSSIFKGDNFNKFFSNLTVSGDSQGQYAYAITVGNSIRTTLTPMTFSKPRFNGVQIDFAADKYAATVIASRISDPREGVTPTPETRTNTTSLIGGRATVQVGDFVTLGGTLIDARNSNAALDMFDGNLIAGNLTSGQSGTPVSAIAVVLSDDSPDDGEGGAALFRHDIKITEKDFETGLETVWRLEQVVRPGTTWPTVIGGFEREGFTSADGEEKIILNYDFTDPAYTGPDLTSIIDVEFEYLLANDYRIQMWSNNQSKGQAPLTPTTILADDIVLFTVERAEGNIQDISNVSVVRFDYGLPTANLIGGFTLEGTDILGFDIYGEWDRNVRYSQYPNAARFATNQGHEISSRHADAAILTVSRQEYPYFGFAELYSIEDDYSTSAFLSNDTGDFNYDAPTTGLFEFVDDNDDQDSQSDWSRKGDSRDANVFPGWDENNDFTSDFNQNDTDGRPNDIPDYDEPFLRHNVDRPEFLFGIDLNNNNWIDRFEDDDQPDYPYEADRKGFNVFGGFHASPEMRVFGGRLDEEMFSDNRHNRSTYGLFTLDKDYSGVGRLRVFNMLRKVEDTIPNDRLPPTPFLTAPLQLPVIDFLPAPDTWINTAWIGLDYTAVQNFRVINKLKYEIFNQSEGEDALGARTPNRDIEGTPLESESNFFGLINKVEYDLKIGSLSILPRFKSELLNQGGFREDEDDREHWMLIETLMIQLPLLRQSTITTGIELAQFYDRFLDEGQLIDDKLSETTGDFNSVNFAFQLSNRSQYLGYLLTTQLGFRVGRTNTESVEQIEPGVFDTRTEGRTETTSFITIYAGVE